MLPITYADILQLDLPALIGLETSIEATRPEVLAYRSVLIAYFRGSADGIARVLASGDLESEFVVVSRLRAEILRGEQLEEAVVDAVKALPVLKSSEPRAELLFCLTIANIKIGNYEAASRYALLSDQAYEQLGLEKKAVKSAFNYLVAQTHLFPNNRFFSDYSALAERAEACGEWAVSVTAELNISRELQKVGAFEQALQAAHKAVTAGEACGNGTREYGFALLQRASVLIALKRNLEAGNDLSFASLIDHPEIAAAIPALTEASGEGSVHRLARFREMPDANTALGAMESNLISLLRDSPREFKELGDLLFPDVVDVFSQRERLKNLIARVRKKQPGLIVRETGRYRLSEGLRKA
jgi:tetratricopeptide (TPR) repeat protein